MANLYPPSTCTIKMGSELVSSPRRMTVRSDNGKLQNSVGVHLHLKSAQECGLMSSAFTAELIKLSCAIFLGGMVVLRVLLETCMLTAGKCLRLRAVAF